MPARLTPKARQTVDILAETEELRLSARALENALRGHDRSPNTALARQNILIARRALGQDAISMVGKRGYRLTDAGREALALLDARP